MTSERNRKIAALAFAEDNEPGPMEGNIVEAECDPDVDACTLLVRDFPEEESLDELKSRMLDFAPLRCPPKRQKDGQVHFVFNDPKDVQSVLDWFKPHPIARFSGYPVQMFALKSAPPHKVWTLD